MSITSWDEGRVGRERVREPEEEKCYIVLLNKSMYHKITRSVQFHTSATLHKHSFFLFLLTESFD